MPTKAGIKVGLALGGGVVRGIAHVGVLSVLEEAGIPIDMVSGTSAGSIVGSLFCAGMTPKQLEMTMGNLKWWRLVRLVWPRHGFLSFDPLRKWLANFLSDPDFSQLHIPMAVVATDLATGCPIPFMQGKVAPAVQASCSVPGIIRPVKIGDHWLGDGSLSDTIPADLLKEHGMDYVIGVDIFSSAIRPLLGPIGMGFTALEILVQRAGGGIDRADCLIQPQLSGKTYIRFSQREALYELGRQAARERLPKIMNDLGIGNK